MTDVAKIGIAVEVTGAQQADAALNRVKTTTTTTADATSRLEKQIAAMTARIAELERMLATASRANADLASKLTAVEAATNRTTTATDKGATATDKARKATDDYAKMLSALNGVSSTTIATTDKLTTSTDKYARTLKALDGISSATITNHAALADVFGVLDLRVRKAGDGIKGAGQAAGVSAQQMTNLSFQLNDIFTQLSMGTSAFVVLAQQGPQITQIFGGVGATFRALLGLINPVYAAIAAVVTTVGLATIAFERQQRSLADTSNRLRATRDDYASLAIEVSRVARVLDQSIGGDRSAYREAGTVIAGALGGTGTNQLTSLILLARDLARVYDEELPDAAKRVAQALREPGQVARQLASQDFPGLNASIARQVELLELQGRAADAAAVVLRAYREASRGVDQTLTPLQRSLNDLSAAWGRVTAATGGAFSVLGSFALDRLTDVINGIQAIADAAARAANAIRSIGAPGPGQSVTVDVVRPGRTPGGEQTVRNALEIAQGQLGIGGERERMRAQIAGLRAGIDAANTANREGNGYAGVGIGEIDEMERALARLQNRYAALRDPIEDFIVGQQRALAVLRRGPDEARTRIADLNRTFTELEEASGRAASPEERARALANLMDQMAAEFANASEAIIRQNLNLDRIAVAWGEGAAAVARLTIQQQAEQEAAQRFVRGTPDYEAAVRNRTTQLTLLAKAQQEVQAAQTLAGRADDAALLGRERDLIGQSAAVRARELAIMREQQRIARDLPLIEEDRRQALIATAGALAEQQATLAEIERISEQATDAITDAFFDAFEGSKRPLERLRDFALVIFRQIAQAAIINPIIQPVVASAVAPIYEGIAQGGVSSLASNALGSMGFNALTGGGGMTGLMNTQLYSSLPATFVGPPAAGQALTVGGALGSAGLGFGVGYGLSSLTGNRAVGAAGGALAGAGYGFMVGGPVGAVVGGVAGLAGGVFGGMGQRGDPYTQGVIALQDGRLVGRAAADNNGDPSGLQSQLDQGIARLDAVRSARGLQFSRGADLFGDRTDRTVGQAFDEIAAGLRPGATTSRATAAVLDSGKVTGIDSLDQLLGRADAFDALTTSLRSMFDVTNDTEQQVAALTTQLDEARKFADEFGLSLSDVTKEMAGDFDNQIRRSILGITDANALALEDQDRTNAARLDYAKKIGADIAQVERLNGLERKAIVDRINGEIVDTTTTAADRIKEARSTLTDAYNRETAAIERTRDRFDAFAKSLRAFREGLMISSQYSPLDPGARLDEARRQFRSIAGRAQVGDVDAIEQLQGASTALLDASRDYYASSEGYFRDFQEVTGVLQNTESLAERQARIATDQLAVMQSQLSALGLLNSTMTSFAQALVNYQQAQSGASGAGAGATGGGGGTGSAGLPAPTSPVVGGSRTGIGDSYRLSGDTLYFPGGGSHQVAGNPQALIDAYGLIPGANGTMIRTRADGGYTPPGLTLVGERGPELVDFRMPARVYTNQQLSGAMAGGADLAAELRALRADVANLTVVTAQGAMAVREAVADGNAVAEDAVAMQRRAAAAPR
ncbi:MAG: phage tail length tape measure family protein [Gemmatimonadota bacterium]